MQHIGRHESSQARIKSGTNQVRHESSQARIKSGTNQVRHESSQATHREARIKSGTNQVRHESSHATHREARIKSSHFITQATMRMTHPVPRGTTSIHSTHITHSRHGTPPSHVVGDPPGAVGWHGGFAVHHVVRRELLVGGSHLAIIYNTHMHKSGLYATPSQVT